MTIRSLLFVTVGLEVAVAAAAVAWRLNSTAPTPPPVAQYVDTLTANELQALPDRFLFDSAEKWRTLADSYAVFGFYAKADACFRLAAAANPESSEIAYHHGYCLVRLGRLDEAFHEFRRLVDQHDSRFASRAWYQLGGIYLRREQPAESLSAFERAGDDHLPSVYQRAKLLVRTGRAVEAGPLLGILAKALPHDVLVWRLRAQVAAQSQQPKELLQARDALEQADLVLELDDKADIFDPVRARFGLDREFAKAREHQQAGHTAAAADEISRLVRPETHWNNVYVFLLQDAAMIQLKAGNLASTREFVDRQIDVEQFPTPIAWRLRGELAFRQENWAQALEAWSRTERMQPAEVDYLKLAAVVEHLGDARGARRNMALAGLFRARALFREGNVTGAQTVLRDALTFDDAVCENWFYLGECERLLGNDRQAEAAYRRCLKLNPGHGRALARLKHAGKSP